VKAVGVKFGYTDDYSAGCPKRKIRLVQQSKITTENHSALSRLDIGNPHPLQLPCDYTLEPGSGYGEHAK
jgi:hypothetical protein